MSIDSSLQAKVRNTKERVKFQMNCLCSLVFVGFYPFLPLYLVDYDFKCNKQLENFDFGYFC